MNMERKLGVLQKRIPSQLMMLSHFVPEAFSSNDAWTSHAINMPVLKNNPSYKKSMTVSMLLHLFVLMGFVSFTTHNELLKPKEVPITVSLMSQASEAPLVKQVPLIKKLPQEQTKPELKPMAEPIKKQKILNELPTSMPVASETYDDKLVPTPTITRSAPASNQDSQPSEVQMPKAAENLAPKEEVTEPPKFGVAYLNNPKPKFPSLSRRAGEEGRVLFKVLVNENGAPETIEMTSSSGFERLDNAALEVLQQWKFVPAKRNNQAISAYVTVPIGFKLKE